MDYLVNTAFPKKMLEKYDGKIENYVLPTDLAEMISKQNQILETTKELRLQNFFTDEIWKKIDSLGLKDFDWANARVLDMACGGGFLSYHLLKRAQPTELTLSDISPSAIVEAKELLEDAKGTEIKFHLEDAEKSTLPQGYYDLIIGNSFLHHFYDVPKALDGFKKLLKPGGIFVTLHEPTPAAVALESGNPLLVALYALRGKRYLEDIRKLKGDFAFNNPGGDVWLFEPRKLEAVFIQQGFIRVRTKNWHLLRSLLAGGLSLHLSSKRPKLNHFFCVLLKLGVLVDSLLNKILPAGFFGSFCLVAFKGKE